MPHPLPSLFISAAASSTSEIDQDVWNIWMQIFLRVFPAETRRQRPSFIRGLRTDRTVLHSGSERATSCRCFRFVYFVPLRAYFKIVTDIYWNRSAPSGQAGVGSRPFRKRTGTENTTAAVSGGIRFPNEITAHEPLSRFSPRELGGS